MTRCACRNKHTPPSLLSPPVPLRGVAINVTVRGFVAEVTAELRYRNKARDPVEAVFVFPLEKDMAIYAFEALVGGKHVEAQIWETKLGKGAMRANRDVFVHYYGVKESDHFTCGVGTLPPKGEARLTLRYAQMLPQQPDTACHFVLPTLPRVPQWERPYTLSLNVTLESPYGIARVHSNCALTSLRYMVEDHTTAQVSLAEGHQFDQDVELLVYYEEVHRSSALLEPGQPEAERGPGGGVGHAHKGSARPWSDSFSLCIPPAQETLILLLKSLPLGCYFNIYGFGSFYPRSVQYTQETMTDAQQRLQLHNLNPNDTNECLEKLQAIYRQPCREGHPRQIFMFREGELCSNVIGKIIAEVERNRYSHRCFSFGIRNKVSSNLSDFVEGIAQAGGGSAELVTGEDRLQAKAVQSLKRALQPAATISVHWSLPPGLEAELLRPVPKVIFQGQRCLFYARVRGQRQHAEGTVTLQYSIKDESFTETLTFPLQPQERARFSIHQLAAQAELRELEWSGTEVDRRRALETSLSSGVLCDQTAYVGVDTELGQPIQGPVAEEEHRNASGSGAGFGEGVLWGTVVASRLLLFSLLTDLEDSPFLSLVSLQNADGSWALDAALTALLGPSESEVTGKMPTQVSVWATVLAILWLHAITGERHDEWQLLEAKALGWLRVNAGEWGRGTQERARRVLGVGGAGERG
uniref:VIT domain-containing protein n=1 Tax=Sphenodon punctatus TaxID=8508 RepID=A0A8D0HS63_SPHPU